jgi:hypothetical protein
VDADRVGMSRRAFLAGASAAAAGLPSIAAPRDGSGPAVGMPRATTLRRPGSGGVVRARAGARPDHAGLQPPGRVACVRLRRSCALRGRAAGDAGPAEPRRPAQRFAAAAATGQCRVPLADRREQRAGIDSPESLCDDAGLECRGDRRPRAPVLAKLARPAPGRDLAALDGARRRRRAANLLVVEDRRRP